MKIDIIGGGIGGLTTAIALQQKGIKTRVFEQAKEIKPIGAGIILANNAMQVFKKLGLKEEIEANGNRISFVNITDAQLESISTVDLTYFEEKYQVQNIAIHRGKLQEILLAQLDQDCVQLDRELVEITKEEFGYLLTFKNGTTIKSECIIGADGIHSKVRNNLFSESEIRNAAQVCWRGVTEYALPKKYQNELNEAWGNADRFGMVQIAPNKVYWYALKSFKENYDELSVEELPNYFADYHPMVSEIIQSTGTKNIHTAVITDLKPIKKWHKEYVCLIGDAAHATTPNMGQGACQSIEDAYILAECLGRYELNKAFTEFQQLRISKAHQVVNASWTLGKVAHWKNPLAVKIRNQLMKMTPQIINKKQSEKIFQLKEL